MLKDPDPDREFDAWQRCARIAEMFLTLVTARVRGGNWPPPRPRPPGPHWNCRCILPKRPRP